MGVLTFLLNRQPTLKRFGELQDIQIDKKNKTINIDFLLKGESISQRFQIFYSIENSFFIVKKIICEKEWMQASLDFILKKEIKFSLTLPFFEKILALLF